MATEIECPGCRYRFIWNGDKKLICEKCYSVIADVPKLVKDKHIERLGIAAGYRRVGRFDDSQQELENLLEYDENLPEALFGCFLNSYEVTEYAFNKDNTVKVCKCNSTSKRPVEYDKDWQDAKQNSAKEQLNQWVALSEKIEELRQQNTLIKNNLPEYRAILICDYTNKTDFAAARGVYEILSKQTDVFFPPVALQDIPKDEQEKYLIQAIKNPEIAPLMFVLYSDDFNYRNKAKSFFNNIAGQCREFAKVHTKAELFSVTCDYEPSHVMKMISIKTLKFKDFESKSYEKIANKILENILICAYSDDEYFKHEEGEIIPKNKNGGLSPKVSPIAKAKI